MATALEVQFQPAPAYLFDYLTADVQTAECVFDLIDNSIDAARLAMPGAVAPDSIPEDYSGFEIDVILGTNTVIVRDNCSGMSEATFANLAFRAGEKSQHPFGIGHFGVGLKRAILKIGDRCTVETDNGTTYIKLDFTREQLDQTEELKLPASKEDSHGKRFTKITIENIKDNARRDLSSLRWKTTIAENFSRRYGLFIRKGLVIKLNDEAVEAFAPQPIENIYVPLQKFRDKIHGVDVEIIAGVHERYRFAQKDGRAVSDPNNNDVHRNISAEYGWYVVCNDRVILLHDKTHKTGWTTNWHGEYAGFVGWVYFRSKDPAILPWNTKKSDIVENGELYEEVVEILRKMAAQYRQHTPLAKTRRTAGKRGQAQAQAQAGEKRREERTATAKDILVGSASKKQLKSIPTLLPTETAFASKMPKLAGLVDESERLQIEAFPYASAIMLRTVFDTALKDYLKRHKKFVIMRDAILDASLKPDQQATEAMRKNYAPSLTEMTKWCIKNADAFPDPHVRVCKQACERFAHHLPVLNGVVHEDGGISNAAQVRTMRDEILQGLLHIIGS